MAENDPQILKHGTAENDPQILKKDVRACCTNCLYKDTQALGTLIPTTITRVTKIKYY